MPTHTSTIKRLLILETWFVLLTPFLLWWVAAVAKGYLAWLSKWSSIKKNNDSIFVSGTQVICYLIFFVLLWEHAIILNLLLPLFVCEVLKLSKIYRKGCENLNLFLIGMWGLDVVSVLWHNMLLNFQYEVWFLKVNSKTDN